MSQSCLLTGCALLIPAEAKTLWGDLHVFNDQYVFNGVLDRNGQAQWNHMPWAPDEFTADDASTKTIVLLSGADYFETRGVIVFPQVSAKLNPAAQAYLKG